jgi:hypothetical protein
VVCAKQKELIFLQISKIPKLKTDLYVLFRLDSVAVGKGRRKEEAWMNIGRKKLC